MRCEYTSHEETTFICPVLTQNYSLGLLGEPSKKNSVFFTFGQKGIREIMSGTNYIICA